MVRLSLVCTLGALVLLGVASAVVADTWKVAPFRSTIADTEAIYSYVPVTQEVEWSAREMRRMRDLTRMDLQNSGMPDPREFAKAFQQVENAGRGTGGTDGGALGPPEPSLSEPGEGDDPTGLGAFEVGLALPSEVIASEESVELLTDIPESAVQLADYMIAFTDGTMFLILSLKGIAQPEDVDWEELLDDFRNLEKAQLELQKKRKIDMSKEEAAAKAAAAARRVVRSTFRIVIGVLIGLMLWFVVRRL